VIKDFSNAVDTYINSQNQEPLMSLNCWEYKKCGREPGGPRTHELGICTAATETRCNGIHSGINAGRVCWLVAGTLCGSEVQGTFARKMATCLECGFYTEVCREEGPELRRDAEILLSIGDPEQMAQAYEELRRIHKTLKETQAQLIQSRKMEAIGQIAAGVAHEINTPTQYIGDNLTFLREAFDSLLKAVNMTFKMLNAAKETSNVIQEINRSLDQVDFPFISQNIPQAIEQSLEGVKRVAHIVRAMKEFSHPTANTPEEADINHIINNVLIISRSEWKYVADVETELDPSMPPVVCFPNELSQTILNLVVNAAQAISEGIQRNSMEKGVIKIATRHENGRAEIRVIDNGPGISSEIQTKIFEPFFTTKEIGKGTGQGLYLAYTTIVKKHQGTLSFESQAGQGATFIIGLSLQSAEEKDKRVPQ
jgi:signal transduction histidine kinase